MLRRKNRFSNNEPDNPMDGLTNLADVMLVFSCGLLLALIINYNIDITKQEDIDYDYEIKAQSEEQSEQPKDDSKLQKKGTVYVDPDTGKMYVVNEDE